MSTVVLSPPPAAISPYTPVTVATRRGSFARPRTPRSPDGRGGMEDSPGADLARSFIAGEPGAVRGVGRIVAGVVRSPRYGIPGGDREDVVQATIEKLLTAVPRTGYRFDKGFEALVRHVAHARCVEYVRRRRDTVSFEETTQTAASSDPSAEDVVLSKERKGLVRKALATLDPFVQELFRMHAFEGLTWEEIGLAKERSPGALRVTACRETKRLSEIIARLEASGPKAK